MISVIIPVHNASPFIRKAVASALNQPEVSAIYLIEDGSTDDSAALCTLLAAESSKVVALYHPNKDNRGAGASRNLGISRATTEFVAFLDADDYYLEDRFKKTMVVLAARPQADGVYEAVEQIGDPLPQKHLITMRRSFSPDKLYRKLAIGKWGSIHINGITVRRTVFERSGVFPVDLPEAQDTVWIMKTAAVAKLFPGELKRPVAVLRVHESNRVTRRPHNRQILVARSEKRNQALLAWAAAALQPGGLTLMQVFVIRRSAEANTSEIRNRFLRFAVKRVFMLWGVRRMPRLWFHPAFLRAIVPSFFSRL
jgi:glycosyltransferase involved in cell wall biosynthesis